VAGHLVPDRTHPAGRLPARRHRERQAGAGLRRQRAADGDAHLRRRRRTGRAGRRPGRARDPGDAADGFQPDHRGVRRRGDRRHGFHPGLGGHRPRPGRHRRFHPRVLSRGIQRRGVRHHGHRPHDPTGRPVRKGGL
ncbi:MAG: High-affinity branched-chain amino acid transport system permease protein LivH, partial [uncultured Ramlibacter sp.]